MNENICNRWFINFTAKNSKKYSALKFSDIALGSLRSALLIEGVFKQI
jgi:hypothetical protein